MEAAAASRSKYILSIALALFLVIYLPVIAGLATEWYNDDNYSHGFLVPAISALLLYLKRGDFGELLNPPGSFLTFRKLIVAAVVAAVVFSFFADSGLIFTVVLNAATWFLIIRRKVSYQCCK